MATYDITVLVFKNKIFIDNKHVGKLQCSLMNEKHDLTFTEHLPTILPDAHKQSSFDSDERLKKLLGPQP